MGRVGSWLAAHQLPIEPDIVTIGKGLGAGYAPLGAVVCRQHVYDALDQGSREFDLGHTWDGAPLPMAVGNAVLDVLVERGLVERVAERGPSLRDELEAALQGSEIVREVRGRGFLLGVELVDPRDGESFLPVDLDVAALVDDTAFEHGLLVTSTHPQADGYAGDQTLLAPAYVSTDEELGEMVGRFAATIEDVERVIKDSLSGSPNGQALDERGVRAPRDPRRQRLDPRQGAAPDGVRVGACEHGTVMTDLHPGTGPGGHADRRLRAVRDPHRAPPT